MNPLLGHITSGGSLFDPDSDLELASAHGSGEESGNAGSSNSNSDEEVVLSAPESSSHSLKEKKWQESEAS